MNMDIDRQFLELVIEKLIHGVENAVDPGLLGHPLLTAIISGFTAALAAYLFNVFHWKITEKRKQIITLSDRLSNEVRTLEDLAVRYWLIDSSIENADALRALEIQIISSHLLVNKYVELFKKYCTDDGSILICRKLSDFSEEIYDLITGSTFKSIKHETCKHRASKISRKCSHARAIISEKILEI